MDRNETLHDSRHLWVPSGASKMISKLTVCSAQTVHLYWTETNTISKRTETSFHLSLVTQKHHSVHVKQFLSLWYDWCKPCTYHTPKLTLSPKGQKGDSIWPTSPRSSIGCVQNDFYGAMERLVQTMDLSCTETNTISKWTKIRFYMIHIT
jgi:hypothetical protein